MGLVRSVAYWATEVSAGHSNGSTSNIAGQINNQCRYIMFTYTDRQTDRHDKIGKLCCRSRPPIAPTWPLITYSPRLCVNPHSSRVRSSDSEYIVVNSCLSWDAFYDMLLLQPMHREKRIRWLSADVSGS